MDTSATDSCVIRQPLSTRLIVETELRGAIHNDGTEAETGLAVVEQIHVLTSLRCRQEELRSAGSI